MVTKAPLGYTYDRHYSGTRGMEQTSKKRY